MKINLQKTKVMVFRNGGILRYYEKWYFDGIEIETVSSYKYMGLFITPKIIWSFAKNTSASQARKSIISMLKLQNSVGYFEYSELFKLFDTMIQLYFMGQRYGGLKFLTQMKRFKIIFVKGFSNCPKIHFMKWREGNVVGIHCTLITTVGV